MSYSNGRVYVDETNHIGVSISDVKKALGASSNDVGSLCTHQNVNRWSKYKPIDANTLHLGTDTSNNPSTNTNRRYIAYKAKDFGYTIPVISNGDAANYLLGTSTPSAMAVTDDEFPMAWQYNAPKGGKTSPYRLSDFIEYLHSTRHVMMEGKMQSGGEDVAAVTKEMDLVAFVNTDGVYSVNDFSKFSGKYLGLVVVAPTSSSKIFRTYIADANIDETPSSTKHPYQINFKLTDFSSVATTNGTEAKAMLCILDSQISSSTAGVNVYPLPIAPFSFKIISAVPDVYPTDNYGVVSGRVITVYVTVTNKGTTAGTDVTGVVDWGESGATSTLSFGTVAVGDTITKSATHSYTMTEIALKTWLKSVNNELSYTLNANGNSTQYKLIVSTSLPR